MSISVNGAALGLLAAVIVLWGANWPILKIGLEYIDPLWFAVLRLLLGILTFVAILAAQGKLRLPPRGDWPVVFTVGLLQMAAFMALINIALMWVPAGRSAILAYTTPLWVAPGAALLLGERLDLRRLMGVGLGLAGIVVLFNPLGFDWSDGQVVAGNMLLLVAALAWAMAIVHVRFHQWQSSPLELAPWQMMIGLVPLVILAWVIEGAPSVDPTPEFLWIAFYNGPLATALAFWAAITVTRMLPAVTVSLAFLCVPVAGLLFSWALLGEVLTATNVVGLALIAAGVAAATVRK